MSKTYSAAAHILQQMGDTIRAAECVGVLAYARVYGFCVCLVPALCVCANTCA